MPKQKQKTSRKYLTLWTIKKHRLTLDFQKIITYWWLKTIIYHKTVKLEGQLSLCI